VDEVGGGERVGGIGGDEGRGAVEEEGGEDLVEEELADLAVAEFETRGSKGSISLRT
jgi:hypothetical protein